MFKQSNVQTHISKKEEIKFETPEKGKKIYYYLYLELEIILFEHLLNFLHNILVQV